VRSSSNRPRGDIGKRVAAAAPARQKRILGRLGLRGLAKTPPDIVRQSLAKMGKPVVRSSLDPTTNVTEKRRSDRLPVMRASNGVEQARDTASQLQIRGREGKEPSGRVRQGQSTVEFCGECLGAGVRPSRDLVRTALSSLTTVSDLARRSMAVLQMPSRETGRSRYVTLREGRSTPRS
jgi:hypothetical protein